MGAVEREEEVGEEEVEDAGDEEGEEEDLWFWLVGFGCLVGLVGLWLLVLVQGRWRV